VQTHRYITAALHSVQHVQQKESRLIQARWDIWFYWKHNTHLIMQVPSWLF